MKDCEEFLLLFRDGEVKRQPCSYLRYMDVDFSPYWGHSIFLVHMMFRILFCFVRFYFIFVIFCFLFWFSFFGNCDCFYLHCSREWSWFYCAGNHIWEHGRPRAAPSGGTESGERPICIPRVFHPGQPRFLVHAFVAAVLQRLHHRRHCGFHFRQFGSCLSNVPYPCAAAGRSCGQVDDEHSDSTGNSCILTLID